jgi:hypothetical protein
VITDSGGEFAVLTQKTAIFILPKKPYSISSTICHNFSLTAAKTPAWSLLALCHQIYVVSLSVGVQEEDIYVAVVVYEAACRSAYNIVTVIWNFILFWVLKFLHFIERTELVSGETSVTILHSS